MSQIERDGHGAGGQLGPGRWGHAQEAVARPTSFLSARLLQMQQPKLCSNERVDPTFTARHCLPLAALLHLFPFISRSYSRHISFAPDLFLPISLPLYFSLLLWLVMSFSRGNSPSFHLSLH